METVMKALMGVGVVILMALIAAVIFTAPAWLIWNLNVADIFNAPHLSFWQVFWVMLLIRIVLPSNTKVKEGN